MKTMGYLGRTRIPENWLEDVVVVWEEDDATRNDPSAEKTHQAFLRLTRQKFSPDMVVAHGDLGDGDAKLTYSGWVIGVTCEGGFVGVYPKPRS